MVCAGLIDALRDAKPHAALTELPTDVAQLLGTTYSRIAYKFYPSTNPLRLAMAMIEAMESLHKYSLTRPSFPYQPSVVAKLLRSHLAGYLRHDWERHELSDEGNYSKHGEEELAAEIRRSA
jgi:hypothetical protein